MNQPPGNGYPPGYPPAQGYPPGQPQQPQPQYGQPQQPQQQYGQPQQPQQQYGQPQQPQYAQPPQQPQYGQPMQVPDYAQPPQQPQYGQPMQVPEYAQPPQQFGQPPQPQYAPPPQQPMGQLMGGGQSFGINLGVPGLTAVNTAGLNNRANSMPALVAPGFFIVAVIIGFAFDIVFSFIHIPFGRYIWYATTFVPFAAAGLLAGLWTKAGRGLVIGVAIGSALLYGGCDVGLGAGLSMTAGAGLSGPWLFATLGLALVSIGISAAAGVGGALKGSSQKDAVTGGRS